MYLLEAFMKDAVFVDFGSEILYGSDQAYISYPIRFATVSFQLMATNALSQIADRVRKDIGYVPMHSMDEYTDETCDNEGWYDFYTRRKTCWSWEKMGECLRQILFSSSGSRMARASATS